MLGLGQHENSLEGGQGSGLRRQDALVHRHFFGLTQSVHLHGRCLHAWHEEEFHLVTKSSLKKRGERIVIVGMTDC